VLFVSWWLSETETIASCSVGGVAFLSGFVEGAQNSPTGFCASDPQRWQGRIEPLCWLRAAWP
jgi:hypothetical protein